MKKRRLKNNNLYYNKKYKFKRKEDIKMSNVISLKKETKINKINPNISLANMIFNKNKRNEIYNFYDSIYTSSKEEDEIFQTMRNKYWKGDE